MSKFLKAFWPFFLLAALAFTVHLAFLNHPSQVVFDEVHFGKFVSAYFTGQYYFDIHPPLGKLLIAGWVKLAGVNPVFAFDKIGETIPPNILSAMRFLPALTGGLFVLAFTWLAYLISRNRTTALLAGFLILLDNAFLVQSKFILVDIFLLFFEVLTFCFFFLWQRQTVFSRRWWAYLIFTAIFFGLTISVKWTGVATLGVIAMVLTLKIFNTKLANYLNPQAYLAPTRPPEIPKEQFLAAWQKQTKKIKIKGAWRGLSVILLIGAVVYLIPFAIHFKLLPHSGPGDAFASWSWQQELKYGPSENSPTFWQKTIELNKTMYKANAGITSPHPYGSRWWSWPLAHKPVYYWNQDVIAGQPGWTAKIYFLSNPLLWWLGAGFAGLTFFFFFSKKGRQHVTPVFYILVLAWLANWLPFVLISRVAFLYHYLLPAVFTTLILTLYLTRLWPKEKFIFIMIIGLIAVAFLLFLPYCYGWPLPAKLAQPINQLVNFFI